jgi:hypothetical protein
MAIQSNIVSGGRRKRNQIAELNARQSMLPSIIANKQRAEDLARAEANKNTQISQFNRQFGLQQSAHKAQQKASRIGMGLEAAKLGTTIVSQHGSKTAGDIFNYKGAGSNINLGAAAGGAAIGFGLGSAITKKKGGKYLGAGLGALAGGFASSIGSGISSLFGGR